MKRSPIKVPQIRGYGVNRNARESDDKDLRTRHVQNLEQQIYFLEMEISHLRAMNDDSGKVQPALKAEVETLTSKLKESKKYMEQMRIELKKKDTIIDLLKTDQFKLHQQNQEKEGTHKTQTAAYMEEMILLRKKTEQQTDAIAEIGAALKESKAREELSLLDLLEMKTRTCDLQEQVDHLSKLLDAYKGKVEELQTQVLQKEIEVQKSNSGERNVKTEHLKEEIQDLRLQLERSNQTTEHERVLRSRLADDNALLMTRHCDLETQLADLRSQLKEEQAIRMSLERIHSTFVNELSETRSRDVHFQAELSTLKDSLNQGRAKCASLTAELNSEQRRRAREELNVARLESKMAELEERLSECRKEGVSFQRDAILFQNDVQQSKKELLKKQKEMDELAQKIVDMQMNVEEYQIHSETSNQLQGTRWRELMNLAEGLQHLSEKAASEHSYS